VPPVLAKFFAKVLVFPFLFVSLQPKLLREKYNFTNGGYAVARKVRIKFKVFGEE